MIFNFNRRTGFTLIELLIVLAIVSVLSGLIIPSVNNWLTQTNESSEIANLKSFVNQVRFQAFSKGSEQRIELKGRQANLIDSEQSIEFSEIRCNPVNLKITPLGAMQPMRIECGRSGRVRTISFD